MLRPVYHLMLLLCLLLSGLSAHAQKEKKTWAVRVSVPPRIDGLPDDSIWARVPEATDFIQWKPDPGKASGRKTVAKVVYDDYSVYVLAMMYDDHPDSILRELSVRDAFDESNADFFAVLFDTYHDRQHAFSFSVTAAGVQSDFKISGDDFESDWNAVWQSEVKILPNGWCAEMRIPYSAIRFPKKEIQDWGVNFSRLIRRNREWSNWNYIDPEIDGIVNQSGSISGIEKIISPLRLSLIPYVAAYSENYPYNVPGKSNTSLLFSGGMDLKYGISESFTLDMTLIPDFSQVQSDNRVLNLSPYEIQYNEKRPFFMEGTELFNKANIFYSRRIGGTPIYAGNVDDSLRENEKVLKNPSQSRLYNATKLSGRSGSGTGIGIFNATSAPSYAELSDTSTGTGRKVLTEPLANYNVFVIDQTFNTHSNISFINTSVIRAGKSHNANVTGTQFKFADKSNKYALQGYGAVDRIADRMSNNISSGYKYNLSAGKISGNYQASLRERIVSNTYDQNDLGYLARNNEFNHYFDQSYHIYKPFWRINQMSNDLGIDYKMLYAPRRYSVLNIDFNTDIDFRNYFSWGTFGAIQPIKKNYDYYEPRVAGRYFVFPANYYFGNWYSSDYRKKFAYDAFWDMHWYATGNWHSFSASISPRYRFSDRLSCSYNLNRQWSFNEEGYAGMASDSIMFGIRNVSSISNEINVSYIFTNRMSLSFRARHYWSKAAYKSYHLLHEDGNLSEEAYNFNSDIDFNAFNIDMVYTWQFLPGSEMSIVWKNSIYNEQSALARRYFESIDRISSTPQLNSISIKLLYYLDYQELRNGKNRNKRL